MSNKKIFKKIAKYNKKIKKLESKLTYKVNYKSKPIIIPEYHYRIDSICDFN